MALRSQEGELRLAHKFVEELKERVKEVKEGKADFHAQAMALESE